ncbi:MAG TPA: FtsW/RodA/SpoVE family cell cycle protein [Acidimicrobiales bacterium]|nr:FtsW/RodA/SpoVE family cell cycle protein [Acidimicrobiales bacterium]
MPPPFRHGRLPRYVIGPKPRRRTELGLLVFGSLLIVALYVIAELGAKSKIPANIGPFLGIVLGLSLVAHMTNRWLIPQANAVILPLAALLNGIGYVIIARWNPVYAKEQAGWAALGVALYSATLLVVRFSRDLERYRYLVLFTAGLLLVAPLLFSPINGARLWVHFGKLEFQPVEFSKILLCVFFASYFATNKEMLSIPTARIGDRLILDPRPLVPIIVAWGAAMAVIGLEGDIGFAALLFTLFIGMLWITTGRFGYLILGFLLFAGGAYVSARYFGQVQLRVSEWLNPWQTSTNLNSGGSQLRQGWYGFASGGIGGTGLGLDTAAGLIPFLTTDMIFAAIGTEMGMVGSVAVVVAFILMIGAGLRVAQTARTDFSRLTATGLTIILGFQAFFIMAGVVRLLPFTGITLPFVAYGGSSLLANYILIALLLRISDEGAQAQAEILVSGVVQPGERPLVPVH